VDNQLEDLIETLRTEAVERADAEATVVLDAARQQAATLLDDARQQAHALVAEAESHKTHLHEDGRRALQQAARDVEGQLRQSLSDLLDRVLLTQTRAALQPAVLADLIGRLVAGWKPEETVIVELCADDAAALQGQFMAGLREYVGDDLQLQVSDRVDGGFRLRCDGDDMLFDFDAQTLAGLLRARLNPGLLGLLEGTDG